MKGRKNIFLKNKIANRFKNQKKTSKKEKSNAARL